MQRILCQCVYSEVKLTIVPYVHAFFFNSSGYKGINRQLGHHLQYPIFLDVKKVANI